MRDQPGAEADDRPGEKRAPSQPAGGSAWDRWRTARIDPGRRGVAVLAVVGLLAALLAAGVLLRSRPQPVAAPAVLSAGVPVSASSSATATPATPATSPPSGDVVVDVAGKVPRPGLVRLPSGSRVDDAVRAAGGALPGSDLSGLNLARRLVDGEQVAVGLPQPAAAPGGAAAGGGLVNLNSATVEQLDGLPGIGPVLANKIVAWRTENGRFGSINQLREVSGIGESTFARLKGQVTV